MLMIFNLWAVVVGAIILIIWSLFLPFFPGMTSEPWAPLAFGILTTVVGASAEIFGLKGRLFFMPIWLIGALIIGFQIGWIGVVSVLVFAVVLIILLTNRAKKKDQIDWIAAKSSWLEYNPQVAGNRKLLLAWGRKAMFFPRTLSLNKEMCAQNLAVLEKLQPGMEKLTADEEKVVAQFREFLEADRGTAISASLDGSLQMKIKKILEEQGRDRQADVPGKIHSHPARVQPAANSAPPPLPDGHKQAAKICFEPETPLENEIYALKYGGALRENVVAALSQSQLVVFQNSPTAAGDSTFLEIPAADLGGITLVAVFTSMSRASVYSQKSSAPIIPVQLAAGELAGRIRKGKGLIVNPGWDFDLRITHQEIEPWINTRIS